jgi:hypothetical protein
MRRGKSKQLHGHRGQKKNDSQLLWRKAAFGSEARLGFFSAVIPRGTVVFSIPWIAP